MGCKLSLQPPSALSQAVAALPPCSWLSWPDVPQPDPPADVLAPQVIISCYTAVLFLSFKLVGSHLGARQLLPPGSQAFRPSVSTLPSAAWGLSSFWQPFQKCIWEVHSPHISFPNATLPSRLETCRTYPTTLKPEEHQPPAWWLAGAGEAALQPLQQPAELVKSPNASGCDLLGTKLHQMAQHDFPPSNQPSTHEQRNHKAVPVQHKIRTNRLHSKDPHLLTFQTNN